MARTLKFWSQDMETLYLLQHTGFQLTCIWCYFSYLNVWFLHDRNILPVTRLYLTIQNVVNQPVLYWLNVLCSLSIALRLHLIFLTLPWSRTVRPICIHNGDILMVAEDPCRRPVGHSSKYVQEFNTKLNLRHNGHRNVPSDTHEI